MKRAIVLILSALLILSLFTGCGVETRVVKAHETQDKTIKKAKDNHSILHAEERKLLKEVSEDLIDEKYERQADSVAAQAAGNLAIPAAVTVKEMKRLTYLRDEKRAAVDKTIKQLEALQSVPDNDLNAALQINAKLKEYAAEPGFDFLALVQGFLSKKEDPLPESKSETIQIPVDVLPSPTSSITGALPPDPTPKVK